MERYPETALRIKVEDVYFKVVKSYPHLWEVFMFGRDISTHATKRLKLCGQFFAKTGEYRIYRERWLNDQRNIEKHTHYFVNHQGYGISEAVFLQANLDPVNILIKERILDNGRVNYYMIPFKVFMREAVTYIDYSNYFRDVQYIFPRIKRLDLNNPTYWDEKKEEEQWEQVFTGVKIG